MYPIQLTTALSIIPSGSGTVRSSASSSPKSLYLTSPSQRTVSSNFSRIPTGSIVHLKAFDTVYEGEYNLIRNGTGLQLTIFDNVQLHNAVEVKSRKPINQILSFNLREIQNVRVVREVVSKIRHAIQSSEKKQSPRPHQNAPEPVELFLNTFVIRYYAQLKRFISIISDIKEIGCTFEGENVGRYGQVSWIVVCAKNTLIPFDIIGLSHQTPKLWDILKVHIFSNDAIVKVFHDARPSADYLFHRHGIALINVFDTKVADANVEKNNTGMVPLRYKPLSACLSLHIPQVPQDEIDYLNSYENSDFTTDSPWMLKPMPPQDILKFGALKLKHLNFLREILTKKLLSRFTSCVQAHIDIIHTEDSSYFLQNPLEMSNMVEAILLTEVDHLI